MFCVIFNSDKTIYTYKSHCINRNMCKQWINEWRCRREFVLLTVPNMNVGSATSATRTSEKLKCSIVRNDRLLVWFALSRQIITVTFVNRIPSMTITHIPVNMNLWYREMSAKVMSCKWSVWKAFDIFVKFTALLYFVSFCQTIPEY